MEGSLLTSWLNVALAIKGVQEAGFLFEVIFFFFFLLPREFHEITVGFTKKARLTFRSLPRSNSKRVESRGRKISKKRFATSAVLLNVNTSCGIHTVAAFNFCFA